MEGVRAAAAAAQHLRRSPALLIPGTTPPLGRQSPTAS